MERGEVAAEIYLADDILIHDGAAREEIGSLHDPVAYRLDVIKRLQHAVLFVDQSVKHDLHTDGVIRYRKILDHLLFPDRSVLESAAFQTYLLYNTLSQKFIDIIILHVKQLVLDRRTTTIDNKNNHSV